MPTVARSLVCGGPQSPFKVDPVPAARGAYLLSEIESCGFRSGVFAGGGVIHGLVE